MAKHDLHVVDNALLNIKKLPKGAYLYEQQVRQQLSTAGRFIFSDEASHQLGLLTKKTQDLMLKNHQFAIPPTPVTYVQLNLRVFHEALGAKTSNNLAIFDGISPDERVGYLWTPGGLHAFSDSYDQSFAAPTAFVLKKVQPGYEHITAPIAYSPQGYSAEELVANIGNILQETQEWNRLAHLLGSSLHHMPDEETRLAFVYGWAMEPTYNGLDYSQTRLWLSGSGELRTVIAAILAINQPQVVHLTSVGRSIGHPLGKRTVYAAHSVVSIELGKRKQYRRLFVGGTHAAPRRHRVRGHFVHYHCKKGCVHDWPIMPDRTDPPSWMCRVCNGLRIWKKAFARGDAAKGFVTNEYDIDSAA